MSEKPNDGPFIVANLAVLIGLWMSHVAYSSGDPSGIQYMLVFMGGLAAGIGLLLWTGARLARYVAPLWFGLVCIFVIAIAALGSNGYLLDQTGRYATIAVGAIQIVLLATTMWRSYRPVA